MEQIDFILFNARVLNKVMRIQSNLIQGDIQNALEDLRFLRELLE